MAARLIARMPHGHWMGALSLRVAVFVGFASYSSQALAHASERGYVLLLPTGYYLVGGAGAVAASFLALFFLPRQPLARLAQWRLPLVSIPAGLRFWTSLAAFLFMLWLLAAGIVGSRDPLSNPLPLTVWTLLWIGLTLLQGLFGNLWHWIDPWYAPVRMAGRLVPKPRALS